MNRCAVIVLLLLLLLFSIGVLGGEGSNEYKNGEPVRVYGNKIGPLHNSFETYDFFRTPGCPPLSWEQKAPTLGQALLGDELYEMNIKILFATDVKNAVICPFKPTKDDLSRWSQMITENYAYQLIVDELPLWSTLGRVVPTSSKDHKQDENALPIPMIYLHRTFYFGTNNGQLVNVTLESSNPVPLRPNAEYIFTYSAFFAPSKVSFEDRFSKYVDDELFEPRIRWFSIINSLVLVMFLVISVTTILSRVLRADYQRIETEMRMRDEGNDDLVDITGWKQLYADVHRVPSSPTLLCALVGTGVQLAALLFAGITAAGVGSLRGAHTAGTVTLVAVAYALTGTVAGFVSSWQFMRYATLNPAITRQWIQCMAFTMITFPAFLASCGTVTNGLAHFYDSAQAVHFGGVAFVVGLLIIGYAPSVVLGTLVGRYAFRRFALTPRSHRELPHVNQIPRLIPPPPRSVLSTPIFILLCGLLPFGSIVFELYLVLSSIWLQKLYYLYTFLLFTSLMFHVVTSCVAITATYMLLNIENHKWPWISFGFGSSCGIYVYAYAVYFYVFRTHMSGLFMWVFYFTYSATLSTAIALIGGATAFLGTSLFIRNIYNSVKVD